MVYCLQEVIIMTESERLYLTINETAAAFGVSRQTVSTWLKEDKIPGARRIRKRWFIPTAFVLPQEPKDQ